MILLRPVCWIWGHKRGKIVQGKTLVRNKDLTYGSARFYACPRCGRETRYKVKQP